MSRGLLLCTLIAPALSGCGEEPAGAPVSGAVTFRGQPLDHGVIQFSPLENQDTQSGAAITAGKYEVPAATGLAAGKYEVRIMSGNQGQDPEEEMPGEPAAPGKELIPAEFNARSKQTVEVKADGPNVFDFAIP
jgi:hypothetical protein